MLSAKCRKMKCFYKVLPQMLMAYLVTEICLGRNVSTNGCYGMCGHNVPSLTLSFITVPPHRGFLFINIGLFFIKTEKSKPDVISMISTFDS